MASISCDKKTGRRTIQFVGQDGKRRSVRLGKVNKRQAETVKGFIEDLLACKVSGSSPKAATAEWIAGLPDAMRRRLERTDLIAPQERRECPTVVEWVRCYIEGRSDVKLNTRLNMEQAETFLAEFFGKMKRLDEITPGDADDFRIHLKSRGLAEATVRRHCKRAKQFFIAAVRKKIIAENPFADLKCGDVANDSRRCFVPEEDMEAVLAACPDLQWKLIFALARYGGLRTPSETFRLRWEDIHWDRGRFTVHSPKTEGHGKATRIVPLFPQLCRVLLEAFGQAEPGDKYVITRYRDFRANLRTHAHRIIRRAGLEPWERTFQNLRSSLETELVEQFPIQTVTSWLRNTPMIAMKHYLMVREEHFTKAVQNPVQYPAALSRTDSQEKSEEGQEPAICGTMQNNATPCNSKGLHPIPPRGIEPLSPG